MRGEQPIFYSYIYYENENRSLNSKMSSTSSTPCTASACSRERILIIRRINIVILNSPVPSASDLLIGFTYCISNALGCLYCFPFVGHVKLIILA